MRDDSYELLLGRLKPWMPDDLLARLASQYGARLGEVVGDAASLDDLGRHFGAGLYEAEVRYLCDKEFARTAEDILWRRTKLGLIMTKGEVRALEDAIQGPS